MATGSEGAEWYIAELVMEVTVEKAKSNVVHRNLVLLRAGSAETAYTKAKGLGEESETSYRNPADQLVEIRFRGIKRLELMYEAPQDGAELTFEEETGVPPDEVERWIPPKERLQVFAPPKPGRQHDPDYRSKEVMEMAISSALTHKK